ncbi:FtsW/RodA/SpoVE family cell cycle protein [Cylindrospermopsis raciborskii LB2897]|uniref:FtsW/RodA/SpoVE family cell cycle protein n=1 Tax=Cylindrospermopsis raciborskii TaxID=77022 RepID=UPI001454CBA8|nr:FtsW/RodA/SpoVE family cell cycle protein [Cylindrospermopsis raciborskii]MBG0743871.1 FtsW/RodA/SpoVE family cell cycle protein [Cylindrospermopsis raciborskii KL1]NLQ08133.1 FtsW/RodA/SpoVE family cell cycle protein [Cylindrospermopsis raciborskii LB2897]
MNLRQLIPFFDHSAGSWAPEARLLRWLTLLWLVLGLIMLFSASYPVAAERQGDGLYYFKRQIIWVFVGLILFNWIVNTPLSKILAASHWFLFVFLLLIFLILVPGVGKKAFDAARWIAIGPIPIQPSELIKPFLVLQSARLFAQWEKLSPQVRLFWLGVFCLVLLGILAQPNLSTTALCGMTIWFIALASGIPYRYLVGTALGGFFLALLSISIKEYQRRRVMSFLNPWADPTGDGYQLVQSLLAVGTGQTWGMGFGMSQQKLFYLPIQDTDFIFAVFAEEFGFVGGMVIFLLLGVFATLGLIIAFKAKNPVHKLVATGLIVLIIGQSLLHIAVTTGAIPTTGLPLPMFSYGGNSMVASLMTCSLLIRVARESSEAEILALKKSH